ncbi:MAG: apolipoprotein N-acyltransferase [SAR324 cluster bacterium]|nr:apolipoprotein N-acyltransferase [SAR324 cluster bacterium]
MPIQNCSILPMLPDFSRSLSRILHAPWWMLAIVAGVLTGLAVPGYHLQLLGLISLLPLLVLLDQDHEHSWKKRWLRSVMACWIVGTLVSLVGCPWIIHSSSVFGHLPIPLALLVGAGYGLEITLILWLELALPVLLIRKKGTSELLLRLFWFLMLEPAHPGLFHWSYGGLTFDGIPWISQLADLIGAPGLGLYVMGGHLWLIGWFRQAQSPTKLYPLKQAFGILLVLWFGGLTYGVLREQQLASIFPESGKSVRMISLQPNFTLQQLASNPALAYSTRNRNLSDLFSDSIRALDSLDERRSEVPVLLVWPESTYPAAFLKNESMRDKVEQFARLHHVFILLTSVDWEQDETDQLRFWGSAFLINPDGTLNGRYDKIFLIPFGEYLPLADWFPFYARWLRENVENMSEFEAGHEPKVFELSESMRISAPICFDVFFPEILRDMVRNGADGAVVLSNLAWFGKTNASRLMEMAVRWNAIENRVPLTLSSNNGPSFVIGAEGKFQTSRTEWFTQDYLIHTLSLQRHDSFYRDHALLVRGLWVCLWIGVLLFRRFEPHPSEASSF